MLRLANDLVGVRVHARDGGIGHVRDLYFDEHDWTVRHVVVDTGHWLPGRHVLVPPRSIVGLKWKRHRLETALRSQQVHDQALPPFASPPLVSAAHHADRRSLHSARGVVNYSVHDVEAEIGHVRDVVVDDASWIIGAIVVDRRRWLACEHVLVPSGSVASISGLDRTVRLRRAGEAGLHGGVGGGV